MISLAEALRPPSEAEVERALERFASDVRRHYGDRLVALLLFGSRARGDHRPDSDADVAVVLRDGDWVAWDERRALSGFSYDRIVEDGVEIQGRPVREDEWARPDRHANPALVRAIRRDGRPLDATAVRSAP